MIRLKPMAASWVRIPSATPTLPSTSAVPRNTVNWVLAPMLFDRSAGFARWFRPLSKNTRATMSRNSNNPTSPSLSRAGTGTCMLRLSRPGCLTGRRTGRGGGRAVGVPLGDAAQLDDALCEQVYVLVGRRVNLVEQLVERDELRPLHVPVSLLGLQLEVDGVGQLLVQEIDHLAAGGFGEIVEGRVRGASHGALRVWKCTISVG